MLRKIGVLGVAAAALALVACGSDSPTATVSTANDRGTLVDDPPLRIASLDATDLNAQLSASTSGQQLLALAGTPACGVDFYYVKYWTVGPGASPSPTEVSGALMVPTGSAAQCSGARPIVLYAHGTNTDVTFNIADVTNPANTEGAMIAAIFAAQGYIVVAPNYAGYDISNLGYHPYLNAAQNADDMMDALTAARKALPNTFTPGTTDSGALFVTGYSEGGYVAMATDKALQAAGQTVTATAPMSGPYALEAFGDAVFFGNVNIGSTVFSPLITTSYQKAYGNIYAQPSDVYTAQYAGGIESLLPTTTPLATLFQQGSLPEAALFDSAPPSTGNALLDGILAPPPNNPLADAGFGKPFLINDTYRIGYLEDALANPDGALPTPMAGVPLAASPQNTLRQAFKLNDMRSWTPQMPMLLCGGDQDPTVFFSVNTGTMAAYWNTLVSAGLITVLDLNATPGGPFAQLQGALQQTEAQLVAAEGQAAAVQSFHTTEAPFCAVAARSFFSQF
jgi:Prolyl oligopeptidase family